ncbi:hypothetical protein chiPu_0025216, partial [Chiloscyllium punctatum]|nr:hypothetical protein [Chiloscyllium punctatum]
MGARSGRFRRRGAANKVRRGGRDAWLGPEAEGFE